MVSVRFMSNTEALPWPFSTPESHSLSEMPHIVQCLSRATELNGEDGRMWIALGILYKNPTIMRLESSLKCFEKAIVYGDTNGDAIRYSVEPSQSHT